MEELTIIKALVIACTALSTTVVAMASAIVFMWKRSNKLQDEHRIDDREQTKAMEGLSNMIENLIKLLKP